MSISFVKAAMEYAQSKYSSHDYQNFIKVMADYSLAIAQEVQADPIVCMTASFLHKMADGLTGNFRSNTIIPVVREIGFDYSTIDAISSCINKLLPEQNQQRNKNDKVVADAYLLTYRASYKKRKLKSLFEFDVSLKLFTKQEN